MIFCIPTYQHLLAAVSLAAGDAPGELEYRLFPDGERYLRILSDLRDQDAALIGGTIDDTSTLDLYDIASGLVASGCRKLTLMLPFFGYSTMERAVRPGEVVTAKTRARLFSSLPSAPFGNHLVLLDLHAEGIPFYFESGVTPLHLYAKTIILERARALGGASFSLACVDAGRAKWVESLANDLGVPASFVYKKRLSGRQTQVSAVSASVKGANVVIYDDMIRSGGSVIQAARAYQAAGAKEIHVICTHGLFTDGALERMRGSGCIGSVSCTDSHPAALRAQGFEGFLHISSIAGLLASCLKGGRLETH